MTKRYPIYLIRWQLSTPILAIVLHVLPFPVVMNTIIANLIGGLLFFWLDRWIFGYLTFSVESEL